MAALPVFPVFTYQQVASAAVMNEVAYDASFLLIPPGQALVSSTSAQSVPNATATPVTWGAVTNTGADVMWTSGSQLTAQTPGYYDLDAMVPWAASSAGDRQVMFRITTGANNPGGAGLVTVLGVASCPAAASGATILTSGAESPYLYVLDYIEVLAYQSSGGALSTSASLPCLLSACLTSLGP